jgi:hypothetical protein
MSQVDRVRAMKENNWILYFSDVRGRGRGRGREETRESGVSVGWEGARNKGKRVRKHLLSLGLPLELTWTNMSCLGTRALTPPCGSHCLCFAVYPWTPLFHPNNKVVGVILSLHAPTLTSSQSFELLLKSASITSSHFSVRVEHRPNSFLFPFQKLLFKKFKKNYFYFYFKLIYF